MKCDELKPLVFSLKDLAYIDEPAVEKNFGNPHDHAVYKATEVDAAIAELKSENRRLKRALWLARAAMCRTYDICTYFIEHPESKRRFKDFLVLIQKAAATAAIKAEEYK